MRLESARFTGFKRFTNTTISGIPATARLVVLAGPNGSGKSSIFDGFRTWHGHNGVNPQWDETYGHKVGTPTMSWTDHVHLNFHEGMPAGSEELKRMIYIRSAFRNEADFTINKFARMASPLDTVRINRLIDNDLSVSDNYQRLIMQTIDGIYDPGLPDTVTKGELRNRIIGDVQEAMRIVFPDLLLTGVGGIGSSASGVGTFYFNKGASQGFLYKNLSAGEKAAFDLLLDVVVKRQVYNNTIWCIDEPETHLNTRVQGLLLQTIFEMLPNACQLWIASHSIGFMRKAWEMAQSHPEVVSFLDLQDVNFDQPAAIQPISPTRDFWTRTLDVALGDLATLVAPVRVVLCEGRPAQGANDGKAEFDAACYRQIFAAEFPNTDFISVGNSDNAGKDRLEVGRTIQAIAGGTTVTRLIDRDMRTDHEVDALRGQGINVLSRRHLEAYLLDDELINKLCLTREQGDKAEDARKIKYDELAKAVAERGKDPDDVKASAGPVYVGLRRLLGLTSAGQTWEAFARDTLSPLMTPDTQIYKELRRDVFGT